MSPPESKIISNPANLIRNSLKRLEIRHNPNCFLVLRRWHSFRLRFRSTGWGEPTSAFGTSTTSEEDSRGATITSEKPLCIHIVYSIFVFYPQANLEWSLKMLFFKSMRYYQRVLKWRWLVVNSAWCRLCRVNIRVPQSPSNCLGLLNLRMQFSQVPKANIEFMKSI